MSLEQYQEIIQLVDKVERADAEFGQDLWLIAERIILHRLTRSKDKKSQLSSIFQVIQEISSESNHPTITKGEGAEAVNLVNNSVDDSNLSSGFSLAVDMLERMDSAELYRLIAWLRNESAFSFEGSLANHYESRQTNDFSRDQTPL